VCGAHHALSKFEALNPKFSAGHLAVETNPNYQNSKIQNEILHFALLRSE
jgi:hypothetical protein